jgi:hypothetical protein
MGFHVTSRAPASAKTEAPARRCHLLGNHHETAARTVHFRLLFGIEADALFGEGKIATITVGDRRCALFNTQRGQPRACQRGR